MNCPNCGAPISQGDMYCQSCGANLSVRPGYPPQNQPPAYPPQYTSVPAIPSQYQPLSPWAYFGLNLLFAVPVIGFIFLLVYSFDDSNLNRRSYARSFWCALLIGLVISLIVLLIFFITGYYTEVF